MRNNSMNTSAMNEDEQAVFCRRISPSCRLLCVLEMLMGLFLIGYLLLMGGETVGVTSYVLAGAALTRLLHCLLNRSALWWKMLPIPVYVLLAGLLMMSPSVSAEQWAFLVGCALLALGAIRMLTSLLLHRSGAPSWYVVNALSALLLGGMVMWEWPLQPSPLIISVYLGVEIFLSGWVLMAAPKDAREC